MRIERLTVILEPSWMHSPAYPFSQLTVTVKGLKNQYGKTEYIDKQFLEQMAHNDFESFLDRMFRKVRDEFISLEKKSEEIKSIENLLPEVKPKKIKLDLSYKKKKLFCTKHQVVHKEKKWNSCVFPNLY